MKYITKKTIAVVLILCLAVSMLVACSNNKNNNSTDNSQSTSHTQDNSEGSTIESVGNASDESTPADSSREEDNSIDVSHNTSENEESNTSTDSSVDNEDSENNGGDSTSDITTDMGLPSESEDPSESSNEDSSVNSEDSSSNPEEDSSSKPEEDSSSKPTEDNSSKPTEDSSSKPTEDSSSKPSDTSTSTPADNSSSKVEESSSLVNESSSGNGGGSSENVSSTDSMFTDRDLRSSYETSGAINIKLNGSTIACNSNKAVVSGTTVTINDEGTYIVSGTLNNGMIIVNAQTTDKVQIVLNGVSISKSNSAPLYVKQADKVFITLPAGKVNTLTSGSSFVAIDESNIDSTVFSKEDMTINGSGYLNISAPAGHGIVSKDDLCITGGNFNITASAHGICGKNSLRIGGGKYVIDSGKDGFHSENIDNASSSFLYIANVNGTVNANITAGGDAVSGQSALTVKGGTFEIECAGGSGATIAATVSAKGFKSTGIITINGGTVKMNTADDGIHSDSNVVISGGNITVDAANDGIQAGGTMTISGGTFNIKCSGGYNGTLSSTESAKGLNCAGALFITNGNFTFNTADDSVHSNTNVTVGNGTFTISSGDDAFHADNTLTVNGGNITITRSYEGLEGTSIVLNGGTVNLTASDDGINAAGGNDSSGTTGTRPGRPGDNFSSGNGSITIAGGTYTINASGDGIDSNGTVTMTGGNVFLAGPTNGGNGSFDYDRTATISGGKFISAGSAGMAQNFSSATNQGAAMFSVGNQAANTVITLKDSSGNVLLTWTAPKTYASVIVSCSDLKLGGTYTLTAGTYTTTFTLSSLVYGSGGGGGGMPPRW